MKLRACNRVSTNSTGNCSYTQNKMVNEEREEEQPACMYIYAACLVPRWRNTMDSIASCITSLCAGTVMHGDGRKWDLLTAQRPRSRARHSPALIKQRSYRYSFHVPRFLTSSTSTKKTDRPEPNQTRQTKPVRPYPADSAHHHLPQDFCGESLLQRSDNFRWLLSERYEPLCTGRRFRAKTPKTNGCNPLNHWFLSTSSGVGHGV